MASMDDEMFDLLPPKLRARMVARREETGTVMNYAFAALGDLMTAVINSGLTPQEAVDLLSVYRCTTIDLAKQLGHEVEPDE